MTLRRARSALLVAAALTAITLSVSGELTRIAHARDPASRASPTSVISTPADRTIAAALDLDRRDGESADTARSHRLVLLAVLGAAIALLCQPRRACVRSGRAVANARVWWLSRAGRSPPLPSLITV